MYWKLCRYITRKLKNGYGIFHRHIGKILSEMKITDEIFFLKNISSGFLFFQQFTIPTKSLIEYLWLKIRFCNLFSIGKFVCNYFPDWKLYWRFHHQVPTHFVSFAKIFIMDMNISVEFPMESLKERQFRLEISTSSFFCLLWSRSQKLLAHNKPTTTTKGIFKNWLIQISQLIMLMDYTNLWVFIVGRFK